MSEERKFVPPPKNALDNMKLRMEADDKLEGGNRRPQLSFELLNNNPRIAVHYNDERTKSTYARMEVDSFMYLLQSLEDIADGKHTCVKIRNKNTYDAQRNKLPKPEVVSQTIASIDDTGKIFISVVEKDKPPIKFYFKANYWYAIVDENNTPLDDRVLSAALCKAKVKFLRQLYASVMTKEYVHPQPRQGGNWGGGNKSGGGNWNRGGGGGNWSSGGDKSAPSGDGMFDDIAI